MNQGEQTRKEQVLVFLRNCAGEWVDGPVLANEAVGGSEGLRRVRELIAEGQPIARRRHPDPKRDIWQYRYSPKPIPQASASASLLPQTAAPAARRSLREAVQQRPDGGYSFVPSPEQVVSGAEQIDYQYKYPADRPLPKLAFGDAAVCPRCKGYRRKAGLDSHGRPRPADEWCRDPDKRRKGERCARCNGHGIVPNVGVIPITLPEGMA